MEINNNFEKSCATITEMLELLVEKYHQIKGKALTGLLKKMVNSIKTERVSRRSKKQLNRVKQTIVEWLKK